MIEHSPLFGKIGQKLASLRFRKKNSSKLCHERFSRKVLKFLRRHSSSFHFVSLLFWPAVLASWLQLQKSSITGALIKATLLEGSTCF